MIIRLRKIIYGLLISVMALSLCFSIGIASIGTENIFVSKMSSVGVGVIGYEKTIVAVVNREVSIDLSGAKVLTDVGVEYPTTSVELASGEIFPNGFTLNNNVISGAATVSCSETVILTFTYEDADGLIQTINSYIAIEVNTYIYLMPNITCYLTEEISIDLTSAKLEDPISGLQIQVESVALLSGESLPSGLLLNGNIIEGIPTALVSNKKVKLEFTYLINGVTENQIIDNITFNVANPPDTITGTPENAIGYVGMEMSIDLSAVVITNYLGAECDILSITANSLPNGLSINGLNIVGFPTIAEKDKVVNFTFEYNDADGVARNISTSIKFNIYAIADNVILSNIPTCNFVYNINNPISLKRIKAQKGSTNIAIKEIICVDKLPSGIWLSNGYLDGKAQILIEAKPYKFKAILENDEIVFFDVTIEVVRQAIKEISLSSYNFIYNGEEQIPNVNVYDQAGQPLDPSEYEIIFYRKDNIITADLTSSGDISVKVVGKGNYTGTQFKKYIINKVIIDDSNVNDFNDIIYDGISHMSPPVFNGYSEKDYTVKYKRGDVVTDDFINIGEITVEVTFSGNYQGQVVKKYCILAVQASENDIVFAGDVEYDGKAHIPNPIIDNKWQKDIDYIVTILKGENIADNYINVGEYTIKVEFINNVTGSFQDTFNIIPKAITPLLGGTVNYVYDGLEKLPATYLVGDYKVGVDYDLLCYRGENITIDFTSSGEINIVVAMKGNYSGRVATSYYIYPSMIVMANSEKWDIAISSKNGFQLNDNFTAQKLETVPFKIRYGANERLECALKLEMKRGEEKYDLSSLATIKLKTNISPKDIKGIRIEYFERGVQLSKSAAIDSNGYIVFDIYSVGDIAIIVDYPSEKTIPSFVYFAIGGGVLLLVLIIIIVIYVISKSTGVRTILPRRRK